MGLREAAYKAHYDAKKRAEEELIAANRLRACELEAALQARYKALTGEPLGQGTIASWSENRPLIDHAGATVDGLRFTVAHNYPYLYVTEECPLCHRSGHRSPVDSMQRLGEMLANGRLGMGYAQHKDDCPHRHP